MLSNRGLLVREHLYPIKCYFVIMRIRLLLWIVSKKIDDDYAM